MLTAGEITSMRATSLAALPDLCEITRAAATEGDLDLVTGDLDPDTETQVYAGVCRVRPRGAGTQERDEQIGDLHETLGDYVATIPHDAGDIAVDDFLTVTGSDDTEMNGRSFRVVHVGWSSWQIDRRLGLEDREHRDAEQVGS